MEECILRLRGISTAGEFGDDIHLLICPRLRVLDLSSWSMKRIPTRSVFQQIADKLVLPALSVLRVTCSQRGTYEVQEVFSSICRLIQRSRCQITVLHFDHCQVVREDVMQLFRTTPTLEDLRLTRLTGFTGEEVIEGLTVDYASSEDPVLPRLRILYISGRCRAPYLVRMVQSRRNRDNSHRVSCLQTLRVCGNFPDPCPGLDDMKSCLQQISVERFSFDICPVTSR